MISVLSSSAWMRLSWSKAPVMSHASDIASKKHVVLLEICRLPKASNTRSARTFSMYGCHLDTQCARSVKIAMMSSALGVSESCRCDRYCAGSGPQCRFILIAVTRHVSCTYNTHRTLYASCKRVAVTVRWPRSDLGQNSAPRLELGSSCSPRISATYPGATR